MFPTILFALALDAAIKQLPPISPAKPVPRLGIPRGEVPRNISRDPVVCPLGTPVTLTTEKK